jgi:putative DNA primase/helicase
VVPRETLLAKGSTPEHPTSVARMRGRRFLQASETGVGRRLDEETVKGLTGGEQQTARFMGANFFDFTPTGKIHLVTNHLPRLTDAESIWRRLHLIAWTQTIPVPERDPRMLQASFWIDQGEAPGILAWAVQGAVAWGEEGLEMPQSMLRDLAEYRSDQDILGEFLALRVQPDTNAFAATSDIYGAYQNWCFNNGIRNVMTAQDLGRALKERRFQPHRISSSRGFRARLLPVQHDVSADPRDPLVTR